MFKCVKCDMEKEDGCFTKSDRCKRGHLHSCKECENKKKLDWRKSNPDRVSKIEEKRKSGEKYKRYYAVYRKQYYKNHKEENQIYNKKWREDNKERIAETRLAWGRRNKDKVWAKSHRRRALKYQTEDRATAEQINKLIRDANNICFWCDCDIPKGEMQIDHIYPLSKKGEHSINNLCVSCRNCNLRKSNKMPDEWLDEILQTRKEWNQNYN